MPHVVHLDLSSASREQVEGPEPPHWLLRAVYGRDLLKAKLRKVRPDLTVKYWASQPELDDALEYMVDVLGLRDWPQPRTAAERVRYLALVLRMHLALETEAPFPDWRQHA